LASVFSSSYSPNLFNVTVGVRLSAARPFTGGVMQDLIERVRLHWLREKSLFGCLAEQDIRELTSSSEVQTACARLSREELGMAELSTNNRPRQDISCRVLQRLVDLGRQGLCEAGGSHPLAVSDDPDSDKRAQRFLRPPCRSCRGLLSSLAHF
jgi:hypothetical protein